MYAEALLIFGQESEPREMLYSEFEAVLNGMVTLPEFAGQTHQAVYVQVDGQLSIEALVFFRLPFDAQGGVAGHWNMPLRPLAKQGGPGPRLDRKNTRLVCQSQCPHAWHADLWEPRERNGRDPFDDIARIMKRNRLGLLPEVRPQEASHELAGADDLSDAQQRVKQLMERDRQLKLRLRQMDARLQQVSQRADELAAENGKLKAYIKALKSRYLKLKATSETSSKIISGEG